MKKITFISFVIIIISCSSKHKFTDVKNQEAVNYIPYYLKVYEADSLFTLKDYKGSFKILDDLFKKYEAKNMTSFFEYDTYLVSSVMTGNTKDIDIKVRKSFRDFGALAIANPDFKKHIDTLIQLSHITTTEIEQLKKEYFNNLNHSLISKLTLMVNEDQLFRQNFNSDSIAFYDKKNKKVLDTIFQMYGYPSEKMLGSNVYYDENNIKQNVTHHKVLLIHQAKIGDKNVFDEYSKLLYFYLKNGTCLPYDYAVFYDSYQWVTKNKQYYGSLYSVEEHVVPLINTKKFDSIRKSIGLPSINYLDWRDKINYGD